MRKFQLFLFLILPAIAAAQVAARDTIINWHTFDYSLNENNTISQSTAALYDTVTRIFHGKILENKFLKVTLVPEFGGRIISMVYKPTGHEELYQNPCGAPYGIGQNWFYYKWLMVYGGIFPTLPEPEHGKAWCLPWEFEILKETPDTVRCRMSWKDTVKLDGIDPNKWKYGKTNLRCDYTLTLIKNAGALEADIELYNDSSASLNYEYWTCLTLAPGSEPGNPKCTGGAEIIIPAQKLKITNYPDIQAQEARVPGEKNIYTFTKLRYWKNWTNDGIAYAWEDSNKNYWGLINHDNEEGIIRVADNNITPGLKIWAWGYRQSQDIDPFKDPGEVHRPYVELWAGHSDEFFTPAQFPGNSEKKWKEVYIPTTGLSDITNANNEILADFKLVNQQTTKAADLDFVTTRPGNNFSISIEITGQNPQVLKTLTLKPDPKNGNHVIVSLPGDKSWSVGDSIKYKIQDQENGIFLAAAFPLDTIATGISDNPAAVKDFRLYQNYPNPFNPSTKIKYCINKVSAVTLKVFNVLGQEVKTVVSGEQVPGIYEVSFNAEGLPSGIYFYRLKAGQYNSIKKMIFIK